MALENKGPGGVKNSYGVRTASTEALANSAIPKNTYNKYGGGLAVTATELPGGGVALDAGGVSIKPVVCVAQSAVPASVTGTTAETTLASIAVPAMGPNDSLRVTLAWSFTGNTNLKTMVAKLNGATFAMTSTSTASSVIAKQEVTVMNRNATNVQLGSMFGFGLSSATSGSFISPSVDTSGANTITVRGQLANAADTITLESYCVELLRG